jgi:ABC-type nitrate/sulfonate/bicarbonate transport system permease component
MASSEHRLHAGGPPGVRSLAWWRKSRVSRWAANAAWFTVPLLLGALAWQALAETTAAPSVPSLPNIAEAWVTLLGRGEILASVAHSLTTVLIAMALAIVAGLLVGTAMARSATIGAALRPYVDMLMWAPLAVLVPVFVVLFRNPTQVIVATAFVYCLFPILENTRLGIVTVPPDLTEVGLGGRLHYYGTGFRTDFVYALTATTVVLSLLLVAVARGLELWLLRRFPQGSTEVILEA